MTLKGEGNPNWKGGKSITSHGYVVVRQENKYRYEHRVLMEKEIGRRLASKEEVHHKNGDKLDNRLENLMLCKDGLEHRVNHRRKERMLRLPSQENTRITCACGCGNEFFRYDESGRPRRYVSGHNYHPSPTMDLILRSLLGEVKTVKEIHENTGIERKLVCVTLCKMAKANIVIRIKWGHYSLPKHRKE